MGIFDWIRRTVGAPEPASGLSRRDFFARVAGQDPAMAAADAGRPSSARAGEDAGPGGPLHTFHVAGFPYHDGPVLVPSLRPGLEFTLVLDRDHPTNPDAVRIDWKRSVLGHVPAELSSDVRELMLAGPVECRAVRVDPSGDLATVLMVELTRPAPADVRGEGEVPDESNSVDEGEGKGGVGVQDESKSSDGA